MTTKPTKPSGKKPLRWGGKSARIAVIPGDGIGKEVTPEAVKVPPLALAVTQVVPPSALTCMDSPAPSAPV